MRTWIRENSEKLSSIFQDIAQIFFASMFVDQFLVGKVKVTTIVGGLLVSVTFWTTSVLLSAFAKNRK